MTNHRFSTISLYMIVAFCIGGGVASCNEDSSEECPTCPAAMEQSCPSCRECPVCLDGDGNACPTCPDCPACPAQKECEKCPVCKEGNECPTCPECKECEQCPTCTNGKECPVCKECPSCPVCNTDELNQQLNTLNNELTNAKKDLEKQKKDLESCQGDLNTCNTDLSSLQKLPKSKSGSRLIFQEHKMSDGSIYVDPYPYDTKLKNTCYFYNMDKEGKLKCCIDNSLISYSLDQFGSSFTDNQCSKSISDLNKNQYQVIPKKCTETEIKGKHVVSYNSNNTSTCISSQDSYYYSDFLIEEVLKLYYGSPSNCIEYPSYTLVKGHVVTPSETKSYYVCEE